MSDAQAVALLPELDKEWMLMNKATDPTAIAEIQKLKRQIYTQDRAQSQIESTIGIVDLARKLAIQSAGLDLGDEDLISHDQEFSNNKARLDRLSSEPTPLVALTKNWISGSITTIDVSYLCSPTGMLEEFIGCDLLSIPAREKAEAVASSVKKKLESELNALKSVTYDLRTQVQELEKVHGTVEVEIGEQRPPAPIDPAVAKFFGL
ncbi:hypothetical protein ACTWM0_08815 [Pseudomonas machongensis]